MLLIKTQPRIPSKRWQKYPLLDHKYNRKIRNFLTFKNHHKRSLQGPKLVRGVRRLTSTRLVKSFISRHSWFPFYAVSFHYYRAPLKEYILAKTIYGHEKLFTHTEWTYPGFKMYPTTLKSDNRPLINQLITLDEVPLNSVISQIFNNKNQHVAYAKSSAATAYRRKNLKKTKLVYVELPSKQLKLFAYNTFCFFAPMKNLFLHKLVEGKWSFIKTPKKLINVRGVAKNPVDHPNGGRTKAKQPELSPWGWIAKHNK